MYLVGDTFCERDLAMLPRQSEVVLLPHERQDARHASLSGAPLAVRYKVHASLEHVLGGLLQVHVRGRPEIMC